MGKPNLILERPHSLPHDEACRVARETLDGYAARYKDYNPQLSWDRPDHARLSLMGGDGEVIVLAGKVVLQLEIPFRFVMFKPVISRVLEQELAKAFP
ncbi:MAG: hypothetical protein GMKNLPBB_02657 [Myxococcota bacterium]|nr:hypothetical protein [Myxococcota bacterium]